MIIIDMAGRGKRHEHCGDAGAIILERQGGDIGPEPGTSTEVAQLPVGSVYSPVQTARCFFRYEAAPQNPLKRARVDGKLMPS